MSGAARTAPAARALAAHLLLLGALAGCAGALPGLELATPSPYAAGLVDLRCESAEGVIHAVAAGERARPAVLFLHGTPGRWRAFERYLVDPTLTARFHLVAVDRLGWGDSHGSGDAAVEPAFDVHSDALAPLIASLDAANEGAGVLLVGHSLGASLAPRLAAQHAAQVRGMLLLAGSHDPDRRARRWYNLLADLPPVRWLIDDDLRRSNDEIMALPEQLRRNAELWPELALPVTVIQGLDDPLVSPGHADFVAERAPHARILRLEDTNHFVPWNRYELVKTELLSLARRSGETRSRAFAPDAGSACRAERRGS